jgi:hypothetical protein
MVLFWLNAYSLTYVGYSLTSDNSNLHRCTICIKFYKKNEKVKIPLRYLNGIILGMNIEHIYRGETNMLTFLIVESLSL